MSASFRAVDPRTGEEVDPVFVCATPEEVGAAGERAWRAFGRFGSLPGGERAMLLDAMARELEEVERELVTRASLETGLAVERLEREFARTVFTLRMYAEIVREGSWVRAAIDRPARGAAPGTIPGHDVRRMLAPLGPVAVFGASNFPLAYGVAGGDTASALAAGCPVIVKGHPSHPGTGAIAAGALARAVETRGLDDGVFSYLPSGGAGEMEVGALLVGHPLVRAVGFTGSFRGGMALDEAARRRSVPIPVFAEMGSTNPVCVLPEAARERGAEIEQLLAGSILDSSGQQCTCPGIVFVLDDAPGRKIASGLGARLEAARENVMLSRRVRDGYWKRAQECAGVAGVSCTPSLEAFARAQPAASGPVVAPAGLLETTAAGFGAAPTLREEVFGPAALVVWCADVDEMLAALGGVVGSLTGTVIASAQENGAAGRVLSSLSARAGRVVFNGVPTGVRVAAGMVHGGPYPATNRPESTAVGAFALERWARPVCFQNVPQGMLPAGLREGAGEKG
jgi:NADP-dependent aldehyde dehydrogenase